MTAHRSLISDLGLDLDLGWIGRRLNDCRVAEDPRRNAGEQNKRVGKESRRRQAQASKQQPWAEATRSIFVISRRSTTSVEPWRKSVSDHQITACGGEWAKMLQVGGVFSEYSF